MDEVLESRRFESRENRDRYQEPPREREEHYATGYRPAAGTPSLIIESLKILLVM